MFFELLSYFTTGEKRVVEISNEERIVDRLETLDILLLSGRGYWFSYVVEWATWSKFSHIGIVLKSPTWLDPSLTGNYLLESGSETCPDSLSHELKFGVQITPLESLIENYNGKIFYRKFNSPSYKQDPDLYHKKIQKVFEVIKDKPYDDGIDLIKAGLRLKLGDCQKTSTFFCSALVTYIFTELGFLPSDTAWDLIEPKDFAENCEIDLELRKSNKSEFGPLELLEQNEK